MAFTMSDSKFVFSYVFSFFHHIELVVVVVLPLTWQVSLSLEVLCVIDYFTIFSFLAVYMKDVENISDVFVESKSPEMLSWSKFSSLTLDFINSKRSLSSSNIKKVFTSLVVCVHESANSFVIVDISASQLALVVSIWGKESSLNSFPYPEFILEGLKVWEHILFT
jgi:hypothetical protein